MPSSLEQEEMHGRSRLLNRLPNSLGIDQNKKTTGIWLKLLQEQGSWKIFGYNIFLDNFLPEVKFGFSKHGFLNNLDLML